MSSIIQLENEIGNTSLTHFDVLVIGSGAGGGPVAEVCSRNGLKVLVLEAGPNYFLNLDDKEADNLSTVFSNDELKLRRRNFIMPDPLTEPRTFRESVKKGERTFVGNVQGLPKTVGGGTVHADLKMPRFVPMDFHLGTDMKRKPSGTNFADWPVDYDMLEPFYLYAERTMGIQGISGLSPYDPPRSAPYPMEPGVGMYNGILTSMGAEKLGYHPYPYPGATNSRPYDGRPACVNCGFCGDSACPIHAKGSSAVTYIRKALLTGNTLLRANTKVTKLIFNSGGNEVNGVEAIGPDGKKKVFTADRYVLAASPIESTRLMLLSDPEQKGIGNSSGQLGRNLTFHILNVVAGVFDHRLHSHRGRTLTHGFSDFRGEVNNSDRPLGGIVEFGGTGEPILESINYARRIGLRGKWLKRLLEQSPLRDRLTSMTQFGEDAPQLTNMVDLDPDIKDLDGIPVARVTYKPHKFELHARKFYIKKMLEIYKASGAKYAFVSPLETVAGSRHIMGTMRFGHDPKTSVCDPNGKFHDLNNLFVSDGSLFPTSSGFNSTLTVCALAAWVGAQMVRPSSPELALRPLVN